MHIKNNLIFLIIILCLNIPVTEVNANSESGLIILLHGLARSDSSFKKMEKNLQEEGYTTCNISYPSTKHTVENLVSNFVLPDI